MSVVAQANGTLGELNRHLQQSQDNESLRILDSIRSNLVKLREHIQRLIHLALNPLENMPALTIAATNVNPISQNILSSLSSLLSEEMMGILISIMLIKGTTGLLLKITNAMRDIAQGEGELTRCLPVVGDNNSVT